MGYFKPNNHAIVFLVEVYDVIQFNQAGMENVSSSGQFLTKFV
jgi:hypothetical protein